MCSASKNSSDLVPKKYGDGWAAGCLIFAFSLFISIPIFASPSGVDDAFYLYAARRLAAGSALYREIWDHKFPVLYAIYTPLYQLGEGVIWVIRVPTIAIFSATAILLYECLIYAEVPSRISLILSFAFLMWINPAATFNAGHIEVGLMSLGVLALLTASKQGRRLALLHEILAGALFAASAGIRPLAVIAAAPIALLHLWLCRPSIQTFVTSFAAILLGGTVVAIGIVGYFALSHRLDDVVLLTVTYNRIYSAQRMAFSDLEVLAKFLQSLSEEGYFYLSAFGVLAIAGLGYCLGRSMVSIRSGAGWTPETIFIIPASLMVGGGLSAMLVGGGHMHYWIATNIGAFFFGGILISKAPLFDQRCPRAGRATGLVFATLFLLMPIVIIAGAKLRTPNYGWPAEVFKTIDALRIRNQRPVTFFEWGMTPQIWVRERLNQVTRPYSLFLMRSRTSKGNVADAFYRYAWTVALADLQNNPPDILIVSIDQYDATEFTSHVASIDLLSKYNEIGENEHTKAYVRRDLEEH